MQKSRFLPLFLISVTLSLLATAVAVLLKRRAST